MQVLFLDQFSVLGGAQLSLVDLLDGMQKRGWQARVALPGDGPLVERLRFSGANVHHIPSGPYHSGSKSLGDVVQLPFDICRQKRILTDLLNSGNFDLVYVNGARLLLAAALVFQDRIPVLFHAHNRLNQRYAIAIAGWSIRRSEVTVVACSGYVARPLVSYVNQNKLHVIPNGTADIGFRERAFDSRRSWRIGLIGRIGPEKGQVEFLEAVALLAPKFPGARFIICGAPVIESGQYMDLVSGLARDLPVQFLGWRDNVAAVLAQLDLLVVPSKDEGMGRVVVEAFSAGVPVIAFATGGIPEVITDGQTGFLVREPTPEALAAGIAAIIQSDPEILHQLVTNARRKWEECYTLSKYRDAVIGLAEQMVSDWRAKHEKAAQRERK
jgi:glycosyltransferase involved in cell wall biosynthesis